MIIIWCPGIAAITTEIDILLKSSRSQGSNTSNSLGYVNIWGRYIFVGILLIVGPTFSMIRWTEFIEIFSINLIKFLYE